MTRSDPTMAWPWRQTKKNSRGFYHKEDPSWHYVMLKNRSSWTLRTLTPCHATQWAEWQIIRQKLYWKICEIDWFSPQRRPIMTLRTLTPCYATQLGWVANNPPKIGLKNFSSDKYEGFWVFRYLLTTLRLHYVKIQTLNFLKKPAYLKIKEGLY